MEEAPEFDAAPFVPKTQYSNKCIGIMTSGGDSPGMNSTIRSTVAMALTYGSKVFAIENGYVGMIQGGSMIRELGWNDVQDISHKGGTIIGSARCAEFRERSGRLKAAENLVKLGINNLALIGGDGTLTGANMFKQEWTSLLAELVEQKRLEQDQADKFKFLNIIGMIGSIDNDMCGFSMTIGADTAMHRIASAVDSLITTAESHHRSFVVEVMGRNCGFLALWAALACGADWVFVPECPPEGDWRSLLTESLTRRRDLGMKYSLVILCEGATDDQRKPIKSDEVKKHLDSLGHDTRITVLGHVQRGGSPSAYDRILGTRCGVESVLTLLNATEETPSRVLGIRHNNMIQIDLKTSVDNTRAVGTAMDAKKFDEVKLLRGPAFNQYYDIFRRVRKVRVETSPDQRNFRVGILHVGRPAAGMNSATAVVARYLINHGHTALAVKGGFQGLAKGDMSPLSWIDVAEYFITGGSALGTDQTLPREIKHGISRIAHVVTEQKIHGLIVIGGFEGFEGILELTTAKKEVPALRIPMALVPATISNNVPGTDFSIGSDTALNTVTTAIDHLKQSASSSRRRAFVLETMGGYCGYLAVMGALAGGADGAYTFEEGVRLADLQADVAHLREKFKHFSSAVFVRNENCSERYTSSFMEAVFEEEGQYAEAGGPTFTSRSTILSYLQLGGDPTPLDRVRACRFGASAANFVIEHLGKEADALHPDASCIIGLRGVNEVFTPIENLVEETSFDKRTPKEIWSHQMLPLVRLLEMNSRCKYADECGYKGESTIVLDTNEQCLCAELKKA